MSLVLMQSSCLDNVDELKEHVPSEKVIGDSSGLEFPITFTGMWIRRAVGLLRKNLGFPSPVPPWSASM